LRQISVKLDPEDEVPGSADLETAGAGKATGHGAAHRRSFTPVRGLEGQMLVLSRQQFLHRRQPHAGLDDEDQLSRFVADQLIESGRV